jgi:type IX secretion system PorP/SprF family membrane protein
MKKYYTLAVVLFLSVSALAQQDPQFSQNMFTKLAVNPAHAGAYDAICGTLLYRNQWTGFDGAPKTFLLMAEMPVPKLLGGLGLTVASDQLGFEKNLMARLAYAHKLYLGSGYLNLGLDAGLMQKSIDGSKFIFNDGGDQSIPLGAVSGSTLDFGFGAYYYDDKLYAGLSADHLTEGEIKMDNVTTKLTRHYYFMAGYDAELTPDITLKPSLFAKSETTSTQIDLNINVMLQNKFWLGFSYRFVPQDALVAMAGLEVTPNLKVGYSYDMTLTDIKTYSSGTHEIMINYCFKVNPAVERQFHKNVRFL